MKQQNESMKKLETGKDYISKDGLIVIDRIGVSGSRGFDGNDFEYNLFCLSPYSWSEATKEVVIEAFERHLLHRYGEDWETMKIKERHPSSTLEINHGTWEVEISKYFDGWTAWNTNGLLYYNGIWVERLEEEPKIHIQDAIKENTVVHCETEQEAKRILGMAHELGYKWLYGASFKDYNNWDENGNDTCYYLFKGMYGSLRNHINKDYIIISSTQIADFEEKKNTDWTPSPEVIEEMDKKAIEKLPIDKVTTKILDIALRMVGIQLDVNIIDKVIDLVELIENKGDDVSIKDIVSLQQTWKALH